MAVFAYGRVSTVQQTTQNQRLEAERAGFSVDFWFADEGVSGKVCARQRPQFAMMLQKIRDGETLVVFKIGSLGRDAIDVLQTVRDLADRRIEVVVLQLGKLDLDSAAGKMLLMMLVAVAEMERDLLVERTQAGLQRAKAQGKRLGRPTKTTADQRRQIVQRLEAGESVSEVARKYAVSRANVIGIRKQTSATTQVS